MVRLSISNSSVIPTTHPEEQRHSDLTTSSDGCYWPVLNKIDPTHPKHKNKIPPLNLRDLGRRSSAHQFESDGFNSDDLAELDASSHGRSSMHNKLSLLSDGLPLGLPVDINTQCDSHTFDLRDSHAREIEVKDPLQIESEKKLFGEQVD